MTTVQPERTTTSIPSAGIGALAGARAAAAAPRTWIRSLREALDRPLTTYYLLIGAAALLLTIGLIMVLSASSVFSFRATGDSYTCVVVS